MVCSVDWMARSLNLYKESLNGSQAGFNYTTELANYAINIFMGPKRTVITGPNKEIPAQDMAKNTF